MPSRREEVILVDMEDSPVGTMEKYQAPVEGKLHRAFSIFLVNTRSELLLQRRALIKYHCGGLWTNTCCSHPRPDENLQEALKRRLSEELGIHEMLTFESIGQIIYQSKLSNGLIEHEYDHLFRVMSQDDIILNPSPEEVDTVRWVTKEVLHQWRSESPHEFTPWFHIILDQYEEKIFVPSSTLLFTKESIINL